ncbi:chromophore lyase CpcT/CpeT [Moorena sp. SIO4A1]|uniref:chromophore lyase CpcT/CpeT n=1 Tax=Moorena sp. SIO4A1 TaxID=2607835 RepID=UPI0025DB1622|nr:chromophore lyase CpcT/CpeT [Moorena sp. SIO4A1]
MKNNSLRTGVAIAFGAAKPIAFLWMATSTGNAVAELVMIEQQVKEVVSHLVGVMDTSAQARANPDSPNVRITTCTVNLETVDAGLNPPRSVFLYQEQALSKRLNSPYRQRFLRIAVSENGESVESRGFKPQNPKTLIGLCNQSDRERVIPSNNLGKAVCSVFLKPVGENYIGQTPEDGCPTNYRGAVSITNTIILHKEGMDTLDRGFDAAGNLVWGAKDLPYQFRWVEPQ